jgi:hypothetical protein
MNKTVGDKMQFGGLKPICETYAGDDSEDFESEEDQPKKEILGFGMPAAMSKTFDASATMKFAAVPKLDFRKLKHVKETKDWYGYQEKLECNVKFLRDKINSLENTNKELNSKFKKVAK